MVKNEKIKNLLTKTKTKRKIIKTKRKLKREDKKQVKTKKLKTKMKMPNLSLNESANIQYGAYGNPSLTVDGI